MSLITKLAAVGILGVLFALMLPAVGRTYAHARARLDASRAWHQARLELQIITMDFPEAESQLAPALDYLNSHQPITSVNHRVH